MTTPRSLAASSQACKPLAIALAIGAALGLASIGVGALPVTAPDRLRFDFYGQIDGAAMRAAPRQVAFTSVAPAPAGSVRVVSTCDDDGPGSLRTTIADAANGDTVDLTALSCSAITLTTGAIVVAVDHLSLRGPGAGALRIDGGDAGRVFEHEGAGTLGISALTISHGRQDRSSDGYNVRGGCIDSRGTLELDHAVVAQCTASADAYLVASGGCVDAVTVRLADSALDACMATTDVQNGSAYGGAIIGSEVTLLRSAVSNSSATALRGTAGGGGIFSAGFTSAGIVVTSVIDSRIEGNQAIGKPYIPYGGTDALSISIGGGIFAAGGVLLESSTVAGNEAGNGGGAYIALNAACYQIPVLVSNSTISGNTASNRGGGLSQQFCYLGLVNSTIAFNEARYGGGGVVPRIFPSTDTTAYVPAFTSSIIARNTTRSGAADVDMNAYANRYGPTSIAGSHSLVMSSNVELPGDSLDVDPGLGPLAANGGPTRTHALVDGSPAIDAGLAEPAIAFDQRGAGYPRVVGTSADIGAYERQPADADRLFSNGFE